MKDVLIPVCVFAAALASSAAAAAAAPEWRPDRRGEIIVTTAPGGGNDKVARLMQKIMQEGRLTELAPSVVNKPGGSGVVAMHYLNQHANDGHFLAITSLTFLAEHISGRSSVAPADVTPVSMLLNEYVGFGVRADSPIRDGRDLMALLKKDAAAVSAGLSGFGNHNHMSFGMVARSAGVELKNLKVVLFNSGGEAMTAALGGHIDVAVAPVSTLLPQAQSGRLRLIGVTAPRRLAGALAKVPTWSEQGAGATLSNWRAILGPRGMSAAQVAYWEGVLEKTTDHAEWARMLEQDQLTGGFLKSADTRAYLRAQYDELKIIMGELGLSR